MRKYPWAKIGAFVGVILICVSVLAADRHEVRDSRGRLLGVIITRNDGVQEARSYNNRLLGTYNPVRDETRRFDNTLVGRSNQLTILIYDDVRVNGLPSSERPAPPADQYQQERMARLQSDQNRGVVLPEVQARWARQGSIVTQEDRRIAIDAVQQAGENRGFQYNWHNPQTGHSGSYLVRPDQKFDDTFYHGKLVPCYRATMMLNAGGETDVQRQVVCKLPHNGVWTTVQVETD